MIRFVAACCLLVAPIVASGAAPAQPPNLRAEVERLRADNERLRAENEGLIQEILRLKQAPSVPAPNIPGAQPFVYEGNTYWLIPVQPRR